jgi:hypothetical protein
MDIMFMIWYKEPQNGQFDEAVHFTATSWAPSYWEIVPLSLAMPQITGMHLIEEIVKTGAIFILRGQNDHF